MAEVEVGKGKPKGKPIRLKCANCGKTQEVVVSRPPADGAEVFEVAKAVGMYPVEHKHIVYLFCNYKCYDAKANPDGGLNPGSDFVREFTCKGNVKK